MKLLALLPLAAAVAIPPYTRQFCGEEGSSTFDAAALAPKIDEFCTKANVDYSQRLDLADGYYLSITDSQGGSYEPCSDALTWVLEECAQHGKLGEWRQNANIYRFGKE
jgi:hypothetical protein